MSDRLGTLEESLRMIDGAPEPWNICFAFMDYLGVRTSEAVGIAWDNLDLSGGVLMVRQSNWPGKPLS
jgi:integrase